MKNQSPYIAPMVRIELVLLPSSFLPYVASVLKIVVETIAIQDLLAKERFYQTSNLITGLTKQSP